MRKISFSVPTASDLGRAARATKTSVSTRISKDDRLANRVEKLKGKLDKAVTNFNEAYKPEVTCTDLTEYSADFTPEVVAV